MEKMENITTINFQTGEKPRKTQSGPKISRQHQKRASKACLSCRARKVRCISLTERPRCTNCTTDGLECIIIGRKKPMSRFYKDTVALGQPQPRRISLNQSGIKAHKHFLLMPISAALPLDVYTVSHRPVKTGCEEKWLNGTRKEGKLSWSPGGGMRQRVRSTTFGTSADQQEVHSVVSDPSSVLSQSSVKRSCNCMLKIHQLLQEFVSKEHATRFFHALTVRLEAVTDHSGHAQENKAREVDSPEGLSKPYDNYDCVTLSEVTTDPGVVTTPGNIFRPPLVDLQDDEEERISLLNIGDDNYQLENFGNLLQMVNERNVHAPPVNTSSTSTQDFDVNTSLDTEDFGNFFESFWFDTA